MDIGSIILQPNPSNIAVLFKAAYRPIYFQVLADSPVTSDQPMYADIYIGPTLLGQQYYKTIASYTIKNSGGAGLYDFDIQDALQEYITTLIPAFPVPPFFNTATNFPDSSVIVFVKFRGSTFSAGLLIPNPTVPVQGTATTAPIAGTGTSSNAFTVVDASIPPFYVDIVSGNIDILDNELEGVLSTKQVVNSAVPTGTQIFPMSNLPLNQYLPYPTVLGNPDLCPTTYQNDNGLFPVMVVEFAVSGGLSRISRNCEIVVMYGDLNAAPIAVGIGLGTSVLTNGTWYIPTGLKDLIGLSPSLQPLLCTTNVDIYYRVAIFDDDSSTFAFISPMFKVGNGAITQERLFFKNSYGHFEGMSFNRTDIKHNTTSSDQFVPYVAALNTYSNIRQIGHRRYNIRSNDEIMLEVLVNEPLLPWLIDLFDSSLVLQQMGQDPVSTYANSLRAVNIIDGTQDIQKVVDKAGTKYRVSVKIRPALDYINHRN